MLNWIFEGIVTWIASIVTDLMDSVSGVFLETLGTNVDVMEEYFPFVKKAFEIFQYTGWALLFLIVVWQLFRAFGGPITEGESPGVLLARGAIFALLIGYAKPVFLIFLNIARAPYTAMMELSMTAKDFSFAGVEQALQAGLVTFVSIVSTVGGILILILLIALGWNYFKMLLEVVERYIVVGVLCYTSPLAYAMGCSKSTSQVFKSWCRMIGSQLLLLVMNVWFLRAFNSSVGTFVAGGGALSGGHGNVFLWIFCALAFLKTAQKFDSYLSSLGLSVAQTGSGMGMEMLMVARTMTGFMGRGGSHSAGSMFRGGGNTGPGAAGAAGGMAGFANKLKGNSYVRDAVVEGGQRMGAGGVGGMPEAVQTWQDTHDMQALERVQQSILDSYELDFAKHAPPKDFPKLAAIWRSIPLQLAKENSKFIFSQVRRGWRAKDLEDALEWLLGAGMVHKVTKIEKPFMPLSSYEDQTFFKLYMSDVGLLRKMAGLPAAAILEKSDTFREFKGALTENYVLCELLHIMEQPPFFWRSGNTAEVDFVLQHELDIVPLEVKSERNDKAKSLMEYRKKYSPRIAVKTTMRNVGDGDVRKVPLYLLWQLEKYLA